MNSDGEQSMSISTIKQLPFLLSILVLLVLSSCASQTISNKSSVMEYLYPETKGDYEAPSLPHLMLPLRVGVAFVPESKNKSYVHNFWTGRSYSSSLTEAKKNELLNNVASHFKGLDFVGSIEVIPTTYLTPGGGFSNLLQIQTMYGIDVIALVSYDQVQFTDEGVLSLSYWTVVGAYLVSGEKNDTNTLMDTVVYDISSKAMLFRAPGVSQVSGKATPINLSEELRLDSVQGFEVAAENMVKNLKYQLSVFKASIKNNPKQATVTHREGYSGGGGAVGIFEITMLFLMLIISFKRKLSAI